MKKWAGMYWAAIDIGTTKICVLIATRNSNGGVEILGIGQHPSYGLRKGVVVDIDKTVKSIAHAITDAQTMAGVSIDSVTVGISGGHIQSFNSHGVVAVKQPDVTQEDIDRVIDSARAIPIPENREVLHILPQYFKVDGQELVKDSLGMRGVRLEAQVHIVTGNIASASNIITCCERAGVSVSNIILEQIASAEATLTSTERELGVGILDIGGGTSDFAIYKDGRIRHSKVLPIAGDHFTNDLAVCLHIEQKLAEALKRKYGTVTRISGTDEFLEKFKINCIGGKEEKEITGYDLDEILRPRAEEIFEIIIDELITFNLVSFMPYGLVLTGGGSMLNGICECAAKMFGMPVRIGIPHDTLDQENIASIPDMLKSPVYSTAYGLLIYSANEKNRLLKVDASVPLYSRIFKQMKSWIYDFI